MGKAARMVDSVLAQRQYKDQTSDLTEDLEFALRFLIEVLRRSPSRVANLTVPPTVVIYSDAAAEQGRLS